MYFLTFRHKYPFVRLIIPLITGICFCSCFPDLPNWMWGTGLGLLVLSVPVILFPVLIRSYDYRWVYGTGIYLFFIGVGILLTSGLSRKIRLDVPEKAGTYVARVSGSPQEKEKSVLLPVRLEERIDSLGKYSCHFNLLLYLPKDSSSRRVSWGDKLLFYSKPSSPRNHGNPDEFDYATYLFHQQVSGTAFVRAGEWRLLTGRHHFDLKQKASHTREKLIGLFRHLGFKGDELAVLSALTLGYKEELTAEVRHAFSVSGVSHVLALSGLHIGLLYVMLSFLLAWMRKIRQLEYIKPFLIIGFLWFFAFISGLSPSVIRSVFMFSLIAFSISFSGRSVTLNTLAAAAFFMLLFNPFYLFDVSFQLSFISVAGIVIIQPRLSRIWKPVNRLSAYFWGLITVTIAAQLVTAPLIIYYFSNFPIHFLWANLLVIPLVTFILYLAVLMLLTGWAPVLQHIIAMILEKVLSGLNGLTSFVEHLPVSSVSSVRLESIYVFGLFLLLLLLLFYQIRRNANYLYACLSCVLVMTAFHLQKSPVRDLFPSILFYNNRAAPGVHFISSKDHSYLLTIRNDSIQEGMKYIASRFWMLHQISFPVVLPENYEDMKIKIAQNIACFSGKKVCLVKDDSWRDKKADKPLVVDYLYICNGFHGHVADLMQLFTVRKVILDSSLSESRLAFLSGECRTLGLDFTSISEKGSYHIEL